MRPYENTVGWAAHSKRLFPPVLEAVGPFSFCYGLTMGRPPKAHMLPDILGMGRITRKWESVEQLLIPRVAVPRSLISRLPCGEQASCHDVP